MEDNELLIQALAQLEENSKINKKLVEALLAVKAENKKLKEMQGFPVEYLEEIITPAQKEVLGTEKIDKTITSNVQKNIKNFRRTKVFNKKEPILDINESISQKSQKDNNIEPILLETEKMELEALFTKEPKKDNIRKFKEMIAGHFVSFTNQFSFIKENDYSLSNLGQKLEMQVSNILPEVSPIYEKMKDTFTQLASNVNVTIQNQVEDVKGKVNNKINNFTDRFFLIGKSSKIRKMKRDFSNALKAVGFEAEELFTLDKKNDFYSIEDVNSKVNSDLNLTAKIQKMNNIYLIPMLDNLDDNLKSEFIRKSIWPKVVKNLEEITGLSLILNKAKDNNKYLNILSEFADKNNFTTEAVIHSLKENSDILKDCKGINVLMKNKEEILISEQKYEILARNIFIVLQNLVKVGNHLQNTIYDLKIDPVQKNLIIEEFINTKIAQEDGKKYTFDIIRKNVGKLLNNKEYVANILESNKTQKLLKTQVHEEVIIDSGIRFKKQ